MKKFKGKAVGTTLNVVTLLLVAGSLFPLYWLVSTSMKSKLDAFALPPKWIFTPNIESYVQVLTTDGFIESYLNSFIVAIITTVIAIAFGVTSGYSLARNKTKGGRIMGLWIILSRMIPPMGIILPFYVVYRELGLLDQHVSLSLLYLTSILPFVTWLIMGFVKGVPEEIEEAAMIDGCSKTGSLLKVVIPIIKPGIATCAMFSFMLSWNEYFYALIMTGLNARTVPLIVQNFMSASGTNWGALAAAAVMVVLPILIFTVVSQKSLVSGLTSGAVKG